jgi:putative membrane protein
MREHLDKDKLALERTLLAAERTFSAWMRTGLAMLGGGLALSGAIPIKTYSHYIAAHIIAGLLTFLGAGIFIHAIIGYRRTYARLSEENLPSTLLIAVTLMTVVLLIIATLVFWFTLQ